MENILKAMRISGFIGLMCLILSMLSQRYVYKNYKEINADTNTAIENVGQIVTYTYQYQLTVYKNSYNKKDYIDYSAAYKNTLSGINNSLEAIKENEAVKQIDPDESLQKSLERDILDLMSKKSEKEILEVDDELTSSIVSQAAIIISYLEANRQSKQRVLTRLEVLSFILSFILLIVCVSSIVVSQKYARTEEKEYEKKIQKENYTDGLTGLLNQKYVTKVLPGIVEKNGSGYIYMFDMDNFKKLNDTCGHAAGDQALKGFAQVMKRNIREKDIACRLGGDEFILHAPGVKNDRDALRLAKRIQVETKKKYEGTELSIVAISCGIAPVIEGAAFENVKVSADKALYHVKENCKGTSYLAR